MPLNAATECWSLKTFAIASSLSCSRPIQKEVLEGEVGPAIWEEADSGVGAGAARGCRGIQWKQNLVGLVTNLVDSFDWDRPTRALLLHWDWELGLDKLRFLLKSAPLKKKKNGGDITRGLGKCSYNISFSRIDLQIQIPLLIGESPLPGLQGSYKVANWRKKLDTPPWWWEEKKKKKKYSHLESSSLPPRELTELIREMLEANVLVIELCSPPRARAAQLKLWACICIHAQATEVPKNLYNIDWLLIENCWGGKEVEQDLRIDSYWQKGSWHTATRFRGLKIQGVFFLWLLSVFILMNKQFN